MHNQQRQLSHPLGLPWPGGPECRGAGFDVISPNGPRPGNNPCTILPRCPHRSPNTHYNAHVGDVDAGTHLFGLECARIPREPTISRVAGDRSPAHQPPIPPQGAPVTGIHLGHALWRVAPERGVRSPQSKNSLAASFNLGLGLGGQESQLKLLSAPPTPVPTPNPSPANHLRPRRRPACSHRCQSRSPTEAEAPDLPLPLVVGQRDVRPCRSALPHPR